MNRSGRELSSAPLPNDQPSPYLGLATATN